MRGYKLSLGIAGNTLTESSGLDVWFSVAYGFKSSNVPAHVVVVSPPDAWEKLMNTAKVGLHVELSAYDKGLLDLNINGEIYKGGVSHYKVFYGQSGVKYLYMSLSPYIAQVQYLSFNKGVPLSTVLSAVLKGVVGTNLIEGDAVLALVLTQSYTVHTTWQKTLDELAKMYHFEWCYAGNRFILRSILKKKLTVIPKHLNVSKVNEHWGGKTLEIPLDGSIRPSMSVTWGLPLIPHNVEEVLHVGEFKGNVWDTVLTLADGGL